LPLALPDSNVHDVHVRGSAHPAHQCRGNRSTTISATDSWIAGARIPGLRETSTPAMTRRTEYTLARPTGGKQRWTRTKRYMFFAWTACLVGAFISSRRAASTGAVAGGGRPARTPRFNLRWRRIPVVRTPTLDESNHRVLYSAMSDVSGDGLGHALSTFNAEVSTALAMGLTYSHRVASFGKLTEENAAAVDGFFGFAEGELPRREIQRHVCDMDPDKFDNSTAGRPRTCQVCSRLRRQPHKGTAVSVSELVPLPPACSYNSVEGCAPGEQRGVCMARLRERLLLQHPAHTLFTMTTEGCDRMGPFSDFSASAGWFYDHYWRRPSIAARSLSSLDDSELTIAVHARRGDFLRLGKHRQPTSSKAFIRAIVSAVTVVQNLGGPMADMPVAVHVYSEGVYTAGTHSGHDVSKMSKDFVDLDGTIQTEHWWEGQLAQLLAKQVRAPPRVRAVMHIAQDTISSLHEMVSSDLFVGSRSGLSNSIVRALSRGVLLLAGPCDLTRVGTSCYDLETGDIDRQSFAKGWTVYATDFEGHLPRAAGAP
jgi:hypothetical protein